MGTLRPYQIDSKAAVRRAWADGARNCLLVLPTGAGKSYTLGNIVHEHNGACCVIAHRQELVSQLSLTLAKEGVTHRIIAARKTIKQIVSIHMAELGRSFYDPSSQVAVASAQTIVRRKAELHQWCLTVSLWICDESHHLLESNQWGDAVSMFPNARGLGVTATPKRADGKGLGRESDGVMDYMYVGTDTATLIRDGFLTPYRIFAPPSTLDMSGARVSKATGDYNKNDAAKAVAESSLVVSDGKSRVVGDIVTHYLRIAPGKLGVTFVPDLDTADAVAEQFNSQGVPAEVISSKTPDADRFATMRRFRAREILQLVNVDILGEGFDCPAIEVVSLGRPTQSLSLHLQQIGRALRTMPGKSHAIIIDHCGNCTKPELGLPDQHREWSLDRRDKKSSGDDDAEPTRVCVECMGVFSRARKECPFCGEPVPAPSVRAGPESVDGDLHELDPATLAELRGEVARVDADMDDAIQAYRLELQNKHTPRVWELANVKRFAEKLEARQGAVGPLREAMALLGGIYRQRGYSDSEIFRVFYLRLGVDWLTAQTLDATAMAALTERVTQINAREMGL